MNTDNKEGAVGFFPVYTFLSHVLPIALVKVDEVTGEIVRDKNGLCVRAGRGLRTDNWFIELTEVDF